MSESKTSVQKCTNCGGLGARQIGALCAGAMLMPICVPCRPCKGQGVVLSDTPTPTPPTKPKLTLIEGANNDERPQAS